MRYFRQTGNPNVTVGIFLLILLAFFAGPNALPRMVSTLVPFADEGVPCTWLKQGTERDRHQSLIGRAASTTIGRAPLTLQVVTSALPNTATDEWVVKIILSNNSIGTVPVVINQTTPIGDTGQIGFGLVFNSNAPIGAGAGQVPTQANIRLLGPRQRCVQRVAIPAQLLPNYGISANSTVKAFYRNSARGDIAAVAGAIYPDQGLWVGVIESDPNMVTMSVSTGG